MLVADPEVPGGERVKILDFGIAKLLADVGGEDLKVRTKTGTMMGTPTYMSPEQCRGNAAVRQPSDVYSLGAMLFEMYAGRPPFVSDGFGELVAMHLFASPPMLSSHVPGIPPELDELIVRMLAKEPAQRPLMTQVAELLLRMSGNDKSRGLRAAPVSKAASPSFAQTTIQSSPVRGGRRKWLAGALILSLSTIGILLVRMVAFHPPSDGAGLNVTVTKEPTEAPYIEPLGNRATQTLKELPVSRDAEPHAVAAKPTASQDSPVARDSVSKAVLPKKKVSVKTAPVPAEKAPEVVKPKFTTTRLN